MALVKTLDWEPIPDKENLYYSPHSRWAMVHGDVVYCNGLIAEHATVLGGTICGGEIYDGTVHGGIIHGGKIYGGEIRGGTIYGGEIYGGEIQEGEVYGGLIRDGKILGGKIYGGQIRGGTVSGGEIHGGVIYGGEVRGGGLYDGIPPFTWCLRWLASVSRPGYVKIGHIERPIKEWLARKKANDATWSRHVTSSEHDIICQCVRYLDQQMKAGVCDWDAIPRSPGFRASW